MFTGCQPRPHPKRSLFLGFYYYYYYVKSYSKYNTKKFKKNCRRTTKNVKTHTSRGLVLGVSNAPIPMGGTPAPPILGFPYIHAYTI